MVWNLRYGGSWDESVIAILPGSFGVKVVTNVKESVICLQVKMCLHSCIRILSKTHVQRYFERFK